MGGGVYPEILATQILGNVLIAAIVLSNVPYFYKIEMTRDVGEFNIYPFVFMIGQALMWVAYGTISNIQGLVPVNAFGLIFNLAFILIYISASRDTKKKRIVMSSFVIYIAILVSFVLIIFFQAPKEKIQPILGWLTCILLVAFYCSPILNFYSMYKQRTTGSLSIPLSITSILSGAAFGLYGYFLEDNFVLVSNFSGCGSGIIQIIWYFIMKIIIKHSPPPPKKDDDNGMSISYEMEENLKNKKKNKNKSVNNNNDKNNDNDNDNGPNDNIDSPDDNNDIISETKTREE
ncbi:hypothetical protein DICPUDRAFT_93972 [Dictyostelium purpureum]|uniref:Bidirectional sugar transporter SWEET n=1 Tax=Dictyostelium purpureum TaxID=5786 RepID=F0ZDU3_DICPU|nr:uncharacterized protein DICPUDRAFT_93972 [Dictyostelium purpureum]EGC37906.1 hypothetical protein DICPUDRAFT_93972 [Dictyostelium purpureum]|eukprot:XP_003285566.1 hypothetical protein DICPUDRAFT_93972 [Dictyostelium purpureum]